MARKPTRRSPRTVSPAAFAKLERALLRCTQTLGDRTEEIERLKRDVDLNVRRIGAMQAEIDHLRAIIKNIPVIS